MKSCGECSLCCKLMGIDELSKPLGVWCQHAAPGCGCRIYSDRPESCRAFECAWLKEPEWPDELRPDRAGVIFTISPAAPDEVQAIYDQHKRISACVGRWLDRIRARYAVRVIVGESQQLLPRLVETDERFPQNPGEFEQA